MAEVECRVVEKASGQLALRAPVGMKVPETIPKVVKATYDEQYGPEHGPLRAGISVVVSLRRNGQVAAISPGKFDDIAAREAAKAATEAARAAEAEKAAAAEEAAKAAAAARANATQEALARHVADGFVNPYGFVPFMRSEVERPDGLGLHAPLGHAIWAPGTYTGSIAVEFTTVTPLLTTQLTRVQDTVGVLSTRRDAAGRPVVAGASVKGAVRSVVEQVTGSRLGVFNGTRPIVRRMKPDEALKVRLARVEEHVVGERLVLRPSMAPPTVMDHSPVETVSVRDTADSPCGKADQERTQTWLQLVNHPPRGGQAAYQFWRALELGDVGSTTEDPGAEPIPSNPPGRLTAVTDEPLICVRGQLHATSHSFNGKHDERLFIESYWDPSTNRWVSARESDIITLTGEQYNEVIAAWETVIDSFDRYRNDVTIPPYAGSSRDIWRKLPKSRTVFITTMSSNAGVQLMPGMVTRKRYPALPGQLLDEELLPCIEWTETSAADRIFGWVSENSDSQGARKAKTAYRGQAAFGTVTCTKEIKADIPRDDEYWTLSTLGQPRPQQFRFYLTNDDGSSPDGQSKETGYRKGVHKLAGHKVYPTHRLPEGYWELPTNGWPVKAGSRPGQEKAHGVPPRVGNRYQSWLAPNGTPAKVTTAIADWVAPGSQFSFRVQVDNLNAMELGALLWVLNLGARGAEGRAADNDGPFCLKLGRGRPLGFGAVKMAVDLSKTNLRTYEQQKDRYRALVPAKPATDDTAALTQDSAQSNSAGVSSATIDRLIDDFDGWFKGHASEVRSAVLAAARGYEDPIIYPRTKRAGDPPGEPAPALESYEWFKNNEQRGRYWALPRLSDPPNLLGY